MITDEMIRDAIETCHWRKEIGGAYICTGECIPCVRCIEAGCCDELKKLFAGEVKIENRDK